MDEQRQAREDEINRKQEHPNVFGEVHASSILIAALVTIQKPVVAAVSAAGKFSCAAGDGGRYNVFRYSIKSCFSSLDNFVP